ncbi:hypothetical protein NX059_009554 [Plenodomus lindquistii]|nr:hypothetical protein NX059_009554 [Plenodomus lindquistii]
MTTKYQDMSIFKDPQGPGDARPTAAQIISDNALEGKWADKTILITGCSSGIGVETARALLTTGATLYLTARDMAKGEKALGDMLKNDKVHLLELDLNSLASVRKCAEAFLASSSKLNILIANAGIMAVPEGRTADGFETQLGTNHLAHFLLIQLLTPTLLASSTPEFNSRVVILASSAHRHGGINFDDMNFTKGYHAWAAYAQSKTANIYTATELERRYGAQGLHAWAVHPGIVLTSLSQHTDAATLAAWGADPKTKLNLKTPQQGAATSVWAATAPALEGQGGKYLEHCQFSPLAGENPKEYDMGYKPHAYDAEAAARLWEKSVEMVAPFAGKI